MFSSRKTRTRGSSQNLYLRFRRYYNISYLTQEIKINKSKIYRALLKYGYSKFSLVILEHCSPEDSIKKEQYFLDMLGKDSNYNILLKAGSSRGFKHSEETRKKMSIAKSGKSSNAW